MYISLRNLTSVAALASVPLKHTGIFISQPTKGTHEKAGSAITIKLEQSLNLEGFKEISIALGIIECPKAVCPSPSDKLGTIIHTGLFNPTVDSAGLKIQSIETKLPADGNGTFQIALADFYLDNLAGGKPALQYSAVTIDVIASSSG